MRIEIRTLVTRDLLRALRDGRIDAAFVSPPEPQDDLAVHVIEREPLLAVLPDDHRLANCASIRASELAVDCHVRLASHVAPALATCVAAFWAREKVAPATELELDTPLSILRLVGKGAGVRYFPRRRSPSESRVASIGRSRVNPATSTPRWSWRAVKRRRPSVSWSAWRQAPRPVSAPALPENTPENTVESS